MHFDVGPFIVIAGAAIAWLNKRATARRRAQAAPAQADSDERTRQVQEEIRRKIDQRRAAAAPPMLEPDSAPDLSDLDVVAERQKKILARMRELEATNAEADKRAAALRAPAAPAPESGWLSELRNPLNARRAMVLREILGAPVALR